MPNVNNGNGISWNSILKIIASAILVALVGWGIGNAKLLQDNTRALAVHDIKITTLEEAMREHAATQERQLVRLEAKLDRLLQRSGGR